MPGADSGLEELVEGSEEPCAAQGEPGLRVLEGKEGSGGRGCCKAQLLRAGEPQTWQGCGDQGGQFPYSAVWGIWAAETSDSSRNAVSWPLP